MNRYILTHRLDLTDPANPVLVICITAVCWPWRLVLLLDCCGNVKVLKEGI